ncbi:carbonic anhydrase [Natrialbaceae archaeon AArc-T1-2]|uniref:carbonic anhydrase n=1 Tax=Natrialbaceae archaeon AArc-T1-2 TaxID=3053904 RepID=UPI00255AC3DC|nr:carbonic anhydrase [Natrialbaceae archaeon AArc-T1-2]WIV68386.1 carbonic anhydrase [Natrialbaceae archaeon AArc-T1-2]
MTGDTDDVLQELLAGNEAHLERLSEGHFADVQEAQHPSVVSICCSDSRVSQEGMWDVEEPGTIFTPSNIGNQTWDAHEGERIVDGSLLYPIHHAGTEAVAVVGHTGCGAVTAAYDVAAGGELPEPEGVAKWVELLVPVVEDGLESDLVDRDVPETDVVNQLVEYNVDHQAQFLRDSGDVPEDVAVYGFVYDFHGVYGESKGRAYLVNLDGVTDPDEIATQVPDAYDDAVASLLY